MPSNSSSTRYPPRRRATVSSAPTSTVTAAVVAAATTKTATTKKTRSSPSIYTPSALTPLTPKTTKKGTRTRSFGTRTVPPSYWSMHPHPPPPPHSSSSELDDDDDDEEMLCTSWRRDQLPLAQRQQSHTFTLTPPQSTSATTSTGYTIREKLTRVMNFKPKPREKLISTKPGEKGAGETETEIDEPPRHLPTTRKIPLRGPLIPPNTLQQRLTPLLFEFSRLLSIVPALLGFIYNTYYTLYPPPQLHSTPHSPSRIDFFISSLWALLTGYQCLCLTTGLLTRWRLYYPPLATLIRLLALQAICWPATHFTLEVLEVGKRPVVVWAVVGTTTCASRSVQIWVTSNLWWEGRQVSANGGGVGNTSGVGGEDGWQTDWQIWRGGKWGGRRWDWSDVVKKCMLPAGVVYCVMAWAEQLRREWAGC